MKRDRQRLWDFEQKKKRKGIDTKMIEKIMLLVIATTSAGITLYYPSKLIAFLLE